MGGGCRRDLATNLHAIGVADQVILRHDVGTTQRSYIKTAPHTLGAAKRLKANRISRSGCAVEDGTEPEQIRSCIQRSRQRRNGAWAFYALTLLSTGVGVGLDFIGINPVKALDSGHQRIC